MGNLLSACAAFGIPHVRGSQTWGIFWGPSMSGNYHVKVEGEGYQTQTDTGFYMTYMADMLTTYDLRHKGIEATAVQAYEL